MSEEKARAAIERTAKKIKDTSTFTYEQAQRKAIEAAKRYEKRKE